MLLSGLFALTACNNSENQQDKEAYYQELSDYILDVATTHPERNFPFIDSLEINNDIPTCVADYFRANTYFFMNMSRTVEFYNTKALEEDLLYHEWPKAYYICSRNLANRLSWKHDTEGALRYATRAFERAVDDTSYSAKINATGLQMFIGICQKDLGKIAESTRSFEESYQQICSLTENDTSLNTHYHKAQNTLAVLMRMKDREHSELVDLWVRRADNSVRELTDIVRQHIVSDYDKKAAENTVAQLNGTKAQVLAIQGHQKEAEQTYQEFLKTNYAQNSEGGRIIQYNYMRYSGRWKEAAAMIPELDTIKKNELMTMETLLNLRDHYETYQKADMPQLAQQRVNRMLEILDSVIYNQQRSSANELAIIYETAKNERTIAEQQAKIANQWVYTVLLCLVLTVLFFIFFLYHRQKEIKRKNQEHHKLEKAYEQLTIANERAEESSKMKTAFIQQISHEIRTPLNILSGFSQIITDEAYHLDETVRKNANQQIVENTNRITEIINKMLELSEAQSHTAFVRDEDTTVSAIVEKAVDLSKIEKDGNISFTLLLTDDMAGIVLHTRKNESSRALSMILDNARKFTKQGDVLLTVRRTVDDKFVQLTVEDTGIGIPAKEAEHIFEEFVQLNEYTEGAGIGLTVARSLARRLGGDIRLDAEHTGGARFVMTLPLD